MNSIDVLIYAAEATPERVMQRDVAVVDVFRATSVIVEAMRNGARRIIPVVTVSEAEQMRERFSGEKVIMGGERDTVLIEGFDKDNSPLAYTREDVQGRTIIFTTTNGTRAIYNSRHAHQIYVAAFLNMSAVCSRLADSGRDAVIVCSGRQDRFTAEDGLCAGAMVDTLVREYDYHPTDIAQVMQRMYVEAKDDLAKRLSTTLHYQDIMKRGYMADIEYCLRRDSHAVVPFYDMQTGEIKL